ncbi:hypothetical protein [Streptomyces sp. NPDC050428]|uniref:hypothetical protein n=1 Tax=Streptomyces sp. NPDC050428 TaxID=3155757 RepID=UPI0034252892
MNQRQADDPEGNGSAVPRDLPDQNARPGDDPLDVDIEGLGTSDDPDPEPAPDTGGVHPEQPVPDEPSG